MHYRAEVCKEEQHQFATSLDVIVQTIRSLLRRVRNCAEKKNRSPRLRHALGHRRPRQVSSY